jgi:hypothetical protein
MKDVELYAREYAVQIKGLSERVAARRFGNGRQDDAVFGAAGLPAHEAASKAEAGRIIAVIDGILTEDKGGPKKQQHTANRTPANPLCNVRSVRGHDHQ